MVFLWRNLSLRGWTVKKRHAFFALSIAGVPPKTYESGISTQVLSISKRGNPILSVREGWKSRWMICSSWSLVFKLDEVAGGVSMV